MANLIMRNPKSGAMAGVSDLYWSYVSVLHNAESGYGQDCNGDVFTVVGSANSTTADYAFGTSSLYFPGASYLTTPWKAKYGFVGVDYTIEMRIKPTLASLGTGAQLCGNWHSGSISGCAWAIWLQKTGMLQYSISASTNTTYTVSSPSAVVTTGVWQHIAITKLSTGTVYIFVNGALVLTSNTMVGLTEKTGDQALTIGGRNGDGAYYVGYIDELRITKGIARYKAAFTVPTTAFPTH